MRREVTEIPGITPKIVNISSISAYTSSTMRLAYVNNLRPVAPPKTKFLTPRAVAHAESL